MRRIDVDRRPERLLEPKHRLTKRMSRAVVVAFAGVLNFALREVPLRKSFGPAETPNAPQGAEQATPVAALVAVGEGDD